MAKKKEAQLLSHEKEMDKAAAARLSAQEQSSSKVSAAGTGKKSTRVDASKSVAKHLNLEAEILTQDDPPPAGKRKLAATGPAGGQEEPRKKPAIAPVKLKSKKAVEANASAQRGLAPTAAEVTPKLASISNIWKPLSDDIKKTTGAAALSKSPAGSGLAAALSKTPSHTGIPPVRATPHSNSKKVIGLPSSLSPSVRMQFDKLSVDDLDHQDLDMQRVDPSTCLHQHVRGLIGGGTCLLSGPAVRNVYEFRHRVPQDQYASLFVMFIVF